ncbi:MAG: riboflavin synthase [Candidatus Marinimicrobia bacterium]|nr:riboflavin synthase [Candidatus Neomarinimicrobiota bacterium]
MFTGIIQAKGNIKEIRISNKGAVFSLNSNSLELSDVSIGDSIAVNGVCLTITQLDKNSFSANVSQETLNCTTFSQLRKRQNINLEKSLRLNQGIDGHFVSGHVDGVGEVVSLQKEGESTRLKIKVKNNLSKYIAKKGSICINGVSLTVNSVEADIFDVNIVPHTLSVTTLGELIENSRVNIEIDIIARHIEHLISHKSTTGIDITTPK